MAFTLTDPQRRALGTIIRAILLLAAGPLIRGHMITVDVLGPALDDFVSQIIGWLIAGGAVVWSWFQKKADERRIIIAAQLPPGSTAADVNAVLKITNPGLTRVP